MGSELNNDSPGGHSHVNLADFIPDEQGAFRSAAQQCRRSYGLTIMKFLIVLLTLPALVFTVDFLASQISLKNQTETEMATLIAQSSNGYQAPRGHFPNKYFANKLIHIKKQIQHLDHQLSIEKSLRERTALEMERIKQETAHAHSEMAASCDAKIKAALTLYDADKIGMRIETIQLIDYALESAGAQVTSTPETIPFSSQYCYDLMYVNMCYPSNPRLLIQPGTLPGQCFAFSGDHGRIRIRLARPVAITAVTVEHAHTSLVEDISSAPKDFVVYGLQAADSEGRNELGTFRYVIDGKPLQTFTISKTNNEKAEYQYVELSVLSNYGNPIYTCVYRFRVHGTRLK